jgi:hypothetical protein
MRAGRKEEILAATMNAEFVTAKGKSYHKTTKCMSLARTKAPAEVTLAQAEAKNLKPCGICYRTKKGNTK